MVDEAQTVKDETTVRGVSFGDLLLGCVLSSLASIGACWLVGNYVLDQREAAFRASIPRIVTVDEKRLLNGFLTASENIGKTDEEFEVATLGWARQFQTMSDDLALKNNLILIRRSNVAAGAEDITDAIGKALYGD